MAYRSVAASIFPVFPRFKRALLAIAARDFSETRIQNQEIGGEVAGTNDSQVVIDVLKDKIRQASETFSQPRTMSTNPISGKHRKKVSPNYSIGIRFHP